MLKIYICPRCYNVRMVSKKPNAICLHCNEEMEQCDLTYDNYTNMNGSERKEYISLWKQRLKFNISMESQVSRRSSVFLPQFVDKRSTTTYNKFLVLDIMVANKQEVEQ